MDAEREVLVEALRDVEETNVPDDLREVAFSKAFDLRAGKVSPQPAVASPAPPAYGGANSGAPPQTGPPSADPLGRIAERLKLDPLTVGEVFSASEDGLELIVPAGKLPARPATATKEIALLIAGGRQAAGLDEWTTWDEIRRWCAEFKRLDGGNFAKTIREMEDVFNFRRESERKHLVRLARPGWERLTDSIRRLGGE
jgi:hypothetical protein